MKNYDMNEETSEFRNESERERRRLLNAGDICAAENAMTNFWRTYVEMTNAIRSWSNQVRVARADFARAKESFDQFSRVSKVLVGESTRRLCSKCDVAIPKEDVVNDEGRFAAFLEEVAKSDAMNALRLTNAAYKVAAKSIGSYEAKISKLKARRDGNGSSPAEVAGAKSKIAMFEILCDAVRQRKDVLVEQSLKIRSDIEKFVKANQINPSDDRDLTDEERKILEALA